VPRPEKIIVAGGNYRSHVDEAMGRKDAPIPSEPLIIFKPSNTVIGPHDNLVRPAQSRQLDYETEIAVVIGRGGRHISRHDAYEHIAGYMIGNDVTARDLAFKDMHLHPMYSQITPRQRNCDRRTHRALDRNPRTKSRIPINCVCVAG